MADSQIVERAVAALNEASGQVSAVWATFLSLLAYLAVAVGATTHVDLLLEKPIRLPLLGVDLGLFAFYGAAPFLLLIFHLYFLVQLYALAGKAHALNHTLLDVPAMASRDALRRRLHVFMLTQALAGPHRGFVPRLLLRLTLWLTAVFLPIAVLVFVQLRFLPYHSETMTWWHRTAILLDLAILWALWPLILHPSGAMRPFLRDLVAPVRGLPRRLRDRTGPGYGELLRQVRAGRIGLRGIIAAWRQHRLVTREMEMATDAVQAAGWLLVASVLVAMFSIIVVTVPGGHLERRLVALADLWLPASAVRTVDGQRMLTLTAVLLEGRIDPITQAPASPLYRNLVIVQRDLVDDALYAKAEVSLPLRGRRLDYATIAGVDLHQADLTGAMLQGADLSWTDLQGAVLTGADLRGARLEGAQLTGAMLAQARLQNASMPGVQLQGADLDGADLTDAALNGARLQGVALLGADLQGAELVGVDLRGASLLGSRLGAALIAQTNLSLTDLRDVGTSGTNVGRLPQRPDDDDAAGDLLQRTFNGPAAAAGVGWPPPLARELDRRDVLVGGNPSREIIGMVQAGATMMAYRTGLVDYLAGIACADRWIAAGIARQVLAEGRWQDLEQVRIALAGRLLQPDCSGAGGLPSMIVRWLQAVGDFQRGG